MHTSVHWQMKTDEITYTGAMSSEKTQSAECTGWTDDGKNDGVGDFSNWYQFYILAIHLVWFGCVVINHQKGEIVAKMASHAIFQYNVLAIDDTHNTWTNMIVKINIPRLLGSSDDKEKIGAARPEGPPLRGFRSMPSCIIVAQCLSRNAWSYLYNWYLLLVSFIWFAFLEISYGRLFWY